MSLDADLGAGLDIRGPVGALIGVLGDSSATLRAIVPPLDADALGAARGAAAGISLGGFDAATGRLTAAMTPLLDRVPAVAGALPAVERALALLELAADPDLPGRIAALVDGVDEAMAQGRDGAIGLVLRLVEIVRQAPEADLLGRIARELERLVSGGAPLSETAFAGFGEFLPALAGAVAAAGALARLDSLLAEAERLAGLAASQLDRGALEGIEAEIGARLGSGAGLLSGFIAALDLADDAAVATAERELAAISARIGALATTLRDGMAFGEATLVHLDPDGLREAAETLRGGVRGAELAPLERVAAALAQRLAGVFSLDLANAPACSLDELLGTLEAQAERLAADLGAIDVGRLLGPLGDGLKLVTNLPAKIAETLEAAAAELGAALDSVRDAVRALPLDDIAGQLRELVAGIAGAIETLTRILSGVEAAIDGAATQAERVLDKADTGLDTFKSAVDGAFAAARNALDAADVDAVVAEIEANIRGFLELVGQADMSPYFDAAGSAIGTAASVVEKVPFDLLPNSMEQEVVDAIRPVKQADLGAVRTRVETTLQITDGTFDLRAPIEAAVAEIEAKIDALIELVRALDPAVLAAPLQGPINDFKGRVEGIRPEIELAPLRQALDEAKRAVAGLEPAALLQPVDAAFDKLLAAVDRFSPAALVAPLDARLDAVRARLIDLVGLEIWRDRLDEIEAEAVRLIGLLDLGTLERDITDALRAFQSELADEPRLGIIDALLTALGPLLGGDATQGAFSRVAAWLERGDGAADQLATRARTIRANIDATATAVSASEPAPLAARLRASVGALALAIGAHPSGPARLRLEAALAVDAPLAEIAAMQAPWRRYRERLGAAQGAVRDLGAEGFAEADATARQVAAAVAPLAPLGRLLRDVLRPLGLTRLDRGLAGLLEEIFETASPKRLAALARPLLAALGARLQAIVAGVIGPLRNALDDLLRVVAVFDLSPLRDRLQTITDAVRAEIGGFRPSALLAEPLAAFAAAQNAIAAFDPLAAVTAALNRLQSRIVVILDKLDLGKLLKQPIALFAAIIETLSQLELDQLLGPLLDRLDAIGAQVEEGLEETFGAFERLQEALPDRVGSTPVGASVGVG